jgi:carboxymethylenebutenolidase
LSLKPFLPFGLYFLLLAIYNNKNEMTIHSQYVNLTISDGSSMQCYTAMPEGNGPFAGIIVFQEAFGVNHHIRNVTERFAQQGFVAIAPEIYHRTAPPGFEAAYTDFPSVAPHVGAMSIETNEADINAAFQWLKAQYTVDDNRIVCIGYCMGGRMSFLANCILPLRAAVSYYGGGIAQQMAHRAAKLHGPMLFFWGGLDKHILSEHITTTINALKDAGKLYMNVEISYADHGFFCDERAAYNEKAANEAWALTLEFFEGIKELR